MLIRFFRKLFIGIFYGGPALLLRSIGVRVITITHPDRIGHLCIEPDCYIKEGVLGLRKNFKGLFLIPREGSANVALLDLWAQKLPIVTSSLWCQFLMPLARFSWLKYSTAEYAVAIDDTAKCASINAQWKGRPAALVLPSSVEIRGRAELCKMGVPMDAWFVCVHSREGGYSPADEHLHSYRNSEISNYHLAMKAIVAAGGWCIRVGEPSSQPCMPIPGVVDYAHSQYKSDWMDMFLCANCQFFLGNSSGLYLLSSVFGVSSALANLIPVSGALPVVAGDIGIPKKLRWKSTGQLLSYSEILRSSFGNFRFTWQYDECGISVEENTPEEILDLALEMLERREAKAVYSEDEELMQRQFQALFRPGHYSYGAASRVGRAFLRNHQGLFRG